MMLQEYNASNQAQAISQGYAGQVDNGVFSPVQGHFRPRLNRHVCTHCGQTGHVVQKYFKKNGYPLGYIPGYKSNGGHQSTSRPMQSFQSRGQFPMQSYQPRGKFPPSQGHSTHYVANIMAETEHSHMPLSPTNTITLDLSKINEDKIHSLIQQFHAHVPVSETQAPSPQISSITDHGIMACQSTSGVYSGIDDW